jgi:prepilin-type N-terminal cleavage/methylation domain-containing protein
MIATPSRTRPLPSGFSLVEMLITIAIMGVLTGLVVTSVSSASRDASRMIAKQQASEVQSAVNAWASSSANMRDTSTGQLKSVESVRASYNAASTTSARFELIKSFLDDSIAEHFLTYTTNTDKLQSEALANSKQYLKLEDWAAGGASYPKVSLYSE